MKKDLAEVKAYAEAMVDSNQARDTYVDKEQDKFFRHLNRQQSNINTLKEHVEWSELRVRALELENESLSAHMNSMADKLCFCTWVEVTSQVDSFVILAWLRKDWHYLLAWPCWVGAQVCWRVIGSFLIFWDLCWAECFQSTHSWMPNRCSHHGTNTSNWWDVPVLSRLWGPEQASDWTSSHQIGSSGCTCQDMLFLNLLFWPIPLSFHE